MIKLKIFLIGFNAINKFLFLFKSHIKLSYNLQIHLIYLIHKKF